MQGYRVSLFTQQDRRHRGKPLGDWLVHLAQEMNLPGATLFAADEGYGRERRLHAAHFFELAEQPIEVVMVLSDEQCTRLFERLRAEGVTLFYVRTPVEFGLLGSEA